MVSDLPYSDMEHLMEPHNVGTIEDADGVGTVGNPVCGDIMKIFLKIENDVITDVKFKTFGCGAAIASSSILTDLIKGKTIEEARKISNQDVISALGGLPTRKRHCSVLAEEALESALNDYFKRHGRQINEPTRPQAQHECCLEDSSECEKSS